MSPARRGRRVNRFLPGDFSGTVGCEAGQWETGAGVKQILRSAQFQNHPAGAVHAAGAVSRCAQGTDEQRQRRPRLAADDLRRNTRFRLVPGASSTTKPSCWSVGRAARSTTRGWSCLPASWCRPRKRISQVNVTAAGKARTAQAEWCDDYFWSRVVQEAPELGLSRIAARCSSTCDTGSGCWTS